MNVNAAKAHLRVFLMDRLGNSQTDAELLVSHIDELIKARLKAGNITEIDKATEASIRAAGR